MRDNLFSEVMALLSALDLVKFDTILFIPATMNFMYVRLDFQHENFKTRHGIEEIQQEMLFGVFY